MTMFLIGLGSGIAFCIIIGLVLFWLFMKDRFEVIALGLDDGTRLSVTTADSKTKRAFLDAAAQWKEIRLYHVGEVFILRRPT